MSRKGPHRLRFIALLAFLALSWTAGCGPGQFGGPPASPTYCDGISSEVGGCAPDRPAFAGQTCAEVAQEFGRQLDARLVAIYNGPESKVGSKAVRAGHYTSVAASLANLRLRRLGLIKECSAPAFVAEAERLFSPELRSHAGELLHDGQPVSYAEWRVTLVDLMSIIDMEEDASVPPPSGNPS